MLEPQRHRQVTLLQYHVLLGDTLVAAVDKIMTAKSLARLVFESQIDGVVRVEDMHVTGPGAVIYTLGC